MSVIPLAGPSEREAPEAAPVAADVEIALPVHNESAQLAASVVRLRSFLDESFPLPSRILVVDNASTDDTWRIARRLADTIPGVSALRLEQKGRGRALRAAWSRGAAPVVAYMDVDLATDLGALLPLVAPLLSGHSDLAIGTRLASGAHVVRSARRELLSRGYNRIVRTVLGASCSDAQCGFKALRREAAIELLPFVADNEWFFDTELLVTAERIGLRIHEVPVDWTDDLDSRVAVLRTIWQDLRGVGRLARPSARRAARLAAVPRRSPTSPVTDPPTSGVHDAAPTHRGATPDQVFADELLRFAGVGTVSTVAYLALVVLVEPWLGIEPANVLAIVVCGLVNTAVHRRLVGRQAGGVSGSQLVVGATLLVVSLAATTAALAGARAAGFDALGVELAALVAGNLVAAVARFGILRTWVFRPRFGGTRSSVAAIASTSSRRAL